MSPHASRVETGLVEVFREQRPRLWAFLVRGAGGATSAEDLLQETFLRAWDHRADLRGATVEEEREGMRRYLWRVARNLIVDEIRLRRRRREVAVAPGGGPTEAPAGDRGAAETFEFEDALRAVRRTVGTLPNERIRRCLQLWLEGLDVEEIARRVSLGAGQVRGLLQRGRSEVIRRAAERFRIRAAAPAADTEEIGS